MKADIVRVARAMEACGLVVGTAGNVSGRLPDGTVAVTPSSTPYADIAPDSLPVVDLDGTVIAGSARPTTEKAMHLACYRMFPEVGGVVHCHAPYASMFAVARRPMPACIEEVILYVGGDVAVADYAMTGTDELAAEAVRHLSDRSAVLLANHGLLCIGKDPADALHTARCVEHTAMIALGAESLGGVHALPDAIRSSFAELYRWTRSQWSMAA